MVPPLPGIALSTFPSSLNHFFHCFCRCVFITYPLDIAKSFSLRHLSYSLILQKSKSCKFFPCFLPLSMLPHIIQHIFISLVSIPFKSSIFLPSTQCNTPSHCCCNFYVLLHSTSIRLFLSCISLFISDII